MHGIPGVHAFDEAIRLGLGMALEQVAAADVAAGRCRELVPGSRVSVPLCWQHWRPESSALAAAVQVTAAAARR